MTFISAFFFFFFWAIRIHVAALDHPATLFDNDEGAMASTAVLTIVIKLGGEYTLLLLRSNYIYTYLHWFFDLGTSSIVDESTHEPNLSILTSIVETAAKLHRDGHNVVIVSSGAVGVGLRRMDVAQRPKYLPRMQVRLGKRSCIAALHVLMFAVYRHWRPLGSADSWDSGTVYFPIFDSPLRRFS